MHRPFLWNNRGSVNDLSNLRPRQYNYTASSYFKIYNNFSLLLRARPHESVAPGACEQEWPALLSFRVPLADCRYVPESFRSSQRTSCLLRLCAEFRRWQPELPCYSSCISSNALSAPGRSWVQKNATRVNRFLLREMYARIGLDTV